MNEPKKVFNKWMVIPFDNKLYEKLNEENTIKNKEPLAKKIKTEKKQPEAISKYLNELPARLLENDIAIKPESLNNTVLNASFNDTDNMEYEEEHLKEDVEEPLTELNENIKEESESGEQYYLTI